MIEYSLQEAHFLIKYYSDKVIGKSIEPSTEATIKNLGMEPCGDNKFWVRAYCHPLRGNVQFFSEIGKVAEYLNIETPENVLKGLAQP